jgi:hypothetical protein
VGLAARLANEELVLRRAARVLSGLDDELSVRAENAFTAAKGVFIQLGDTQVTVHRPDAVQAKRGQIIVERLRRIR